MRKIRAAAATLCAAAVTMAGQAPATAHTQQSGPYRSVTIHERRSGQLRAIPSNSIPRTRLAEPRAESGTATNASWSGHVDVACGSCHLRYVAADFTLPRLNCANSPNESFVSYWVGLDGWQDGTVEQTGLEADCQDTGPGGTPQDEYVVFTEMYPAPTEGYSITAAPGDNIAVSVYYDQAARTWALTLDDTTIGAGFNIVATCPAGSVCLNKTAEVITEAPYLSGVLPLADFGQVNYSGGRVTSYNGTRYGLGDSPLWSSYTVTLTGSAGDLEAIPGPLINGTISGIPVSDFSGFWMAST